MPVESHPNTEIYNRAIHTAYVGCVTIVKLNIQALFDTMHEGK